MKMKIEHDTNADTFRFVFGESEISLEIRSPQKPDIEAMCTAWYLKTLGFHRE